MYGLFRCPCCRIMFGMLRLIPGTAAVVRPTTKAIGTGAAYGLIPSAECASAPQWRSTDDTLIRHMDYFSGGRFVE